MAPLIMLALVKSLLLLVVVVVVFDEDDAPLSPASELVAKSKYGLTSFVKEECGYCCDVETAIMASVPRNIVRTAARIDPITTHRLHVLSAAYSPPSSRSSSASSSPPSLSE